MKEGIWGTVIVVAGLFGIGLIFLLINLTSNDQNDYYILKEVTQAAMLDAVDIEYYEYHGDFRIVREQFVESFIRRWSASVTKRQDVTIEILDVIEMPPKVSVSVTTTDGSSVLQLDGSEMDYNVVNRIDAILETEKLNGV